MMNNPIISKDDMAKLLGRSLSATEDTNYDMYLGIAIERIKDLLCLTELPDTLPIDLQLLIARCFAVFSVEQGTTLENIENKKVEDFSVSYNTESKETPMSRFVHLNVIAISKYSQCQAKSKSGELCYGDSFRFI